MRRWWCVLCIASKGIVLGHNFKRGSDTKIFQIKAKAPQCDFAISPNGHHFGFVWEQDRNSRALPANHITALLAYLLSLFSHQVNLLFHMPGLCVDFGQRSIEKTGLSQINEHLSESTQRDSTCKADIPNIDVLFPCVLFGFSSGFLIALYGVDICDKRSRWGASLIGLECLGSTASVSWLLIGLGWSSHNQKTCDNQYFQHDAEIVPTFVPQLSLGGTGKGVMHRQPDNVRGWIV